MLFKRITVFYTVVLVIIFGFLINLASKTVKTIINSEVSSYYEMEFSYKTAEINNFVERIHSDMLSICSSTDVHSLINTYETSHEEKELFNDQFGLNLEKFYRIKDLISNSDIMKATIYMPESNLAIICTNTSFFVQSYENNNIINESIEQPGTFIYHTNNKGNNNSVQISKAIYDTKNWNNVLAVLTCEIDISTIGSHILSTQGSMYLFDRNNTQIYPYQANDLVLENIKGNDFKNKYEIIGDTLYYSKPISINDWILVSTVPLDNIFESMNSFLRSFVAAAILILILTMILFALYTNYVTYPIRDLAEKISNTTSEPFNEIEYRFKSKDEVSVLYESFNKMIRHINDLFAKVRMANYAEKEAELKALQAQINPHFIYNILDSINWLAVKHKAYDIQQMVLDLATMLRFSLNNGQNIIFVKDELEQVRSYIKLQQIRYPNMFKVTYNIDERILSFRIIKLLLQPLVENAIVHGFDQIDYCGIILIDGFLKKDNIILRISNNGNMVDLEKIQKYLNYTPDEQVSSYGLKNVNDRLKNLYGDEYGIKFSIENNYTVATITIPISPV